MYCLFSVITGFLTCVSVVGFLLWGLYLILKYVFSSAYTPFISLLLRHQFQFSPVFSFVSFDFYMLGGELTSVVYFHLNNKGKSSQSLVADYHICISTCFTNHWTWTPTILVKLEEFICLPYFPKYFMDIR